MMDRGRPNNPLEYTPNGQPYLGSALRQKRRAKNLGLRQFAALIPYHYGALSNVENNRATVSSETLKRIAELLDDDAGELAQRPVHPRLSQQKAGDREQPSPGDQTRALEALTAEVQALKAEVAKVAPEARYGRRLLPATTGAGAFGSGSGLEDQRPRSTAGQQQTDTGSQQLDQIIALLVKQIVDGAQLTLTPEKRILAEWLILENSLSVCGVLAKEQDQRRR
jgi:transcriptional regulator with XRE-family HTH domain